MNLFCLILAGVIGGRMFLQYNSGVEMGMISTIVGTLLVIGLAAAGMGLFDNHCPACKGEIPKDATVCMHCGQNIRYE